MRPRPDGERELLAALAEDASAHDVYADWLDEQGRGASAAFLRLERRWQPTAAPGAELLELSRLAHGLDASWLCEVSAVRQELRALLRRFARAAPWACADADIEEGQRPWPAADPLRAFFASRVGEAASRFCWPIDHRLLLTLTGSIGSTSRTVPRTSDRVGGVAEVVARTLEQERGSDLPADRLVGRGLWIYAETDDYGRGIFLSADATRHHFGAAQRNPVHPWFRLRYAPQTLRRSTLTRWRLRVARLERSTGR